VQKPAQEDQGFSPSNKAANSSMFATKELLKSRVRLQSGEQGADQREAVIEKRAQVSMKERKFQEARILQDREKIQKERTLPEARKAQEAKILQEESIPRKFKRQLWRLRRAPVKSRQAVLRNLLRMWKRGR
jgi:hypothetical protein